MQENMDAWLEFDNTRLGLCFDEQDLVFVSGNVKASRWAFGASAGEKHRDEEKYACKILGPELSEDEGPRFAGHRFPICHSGGDTHAASASSDMPEQCLAIHYCKMRRRTSGGGPAERVSSPYDDVKCEAEPVYRSPDEVRFVGALGG